MYLKFSFHVSSVSDPFFQCIHHMNGLVFLNKPRETASSSSPVRFSGAEMRCPGEQDAFGVFLDLYDSDVVRAPWGLLKAF